MKQGPSTSRAGDQKREPIAHAVDICSVADMGNAQVYAHGATSKPLYEGRGFEAPMAGVDTHPKGSQGQH